MRGAPLLMVSLAALGLASCEREDRDYRPNPVATETTERVALSPLSPGVGDPSTYTTNKGRDIQINAFHLSQGKKLFSWFNCVGCHANGGGGSGPPLMDDTWIYGGSLENVVHTIREGRPNGMPAFRGKIPDDQIWEIAAYVRSMSGNAPSAAAPTRNDDMHPGPSESRRSPSPPIMGGTSPPSGQMPQ
jgi:cytochrome c oxidase cbb3-type subunit 3